MQPERYLRNLLSISQTNKGAWRNAACWWSGCGAWAVCGGYLGRLGVGFCV